MSLALTFTEQKMMSFAHSIDNALASKTLKNRMPCGLILKQCHGLRKPRQEYIITLQHNV